MLLSCVSSRLYLLAGFGAVSRAEVIILNITRETHETIQLVESRAARKPSRWRMRVATMGVIFMNLLFYATGYMMRPTSNKQLLLIPSAMLLAACASDYEHSTADPPPPDRVIEEPRGLFDPPIQADRARDLPAYDARSATRDARPVGSEDLVLVEARNIAIASDATTDALYIVDLVNETLRKKVFLGEDAWPGRLSAAEESFYVILRGSDELVKLDYEGNIITRSRTCSAPRGVTHDPFRDKVWVSCASSALDGFEPDTLERTSRFYVKPDLRDIVASKTGLYLSTFRDAEVLRVNPATGDILQSAHAPSPVVGTSIPPEQLVSTMWRFAATTDGKLIFSYQRTNPRPLLVVDEDTVPPAMETTGRDESEPPHEIDILGLNAGYGSDSADCLDGPSGSIVAVGTIKPEGDFEFLATDCVSKPIVVDVDLGHCSEIVATSGAARITEPRQGEETGADRMNFGSNNSCSQFTEITRGHQALASAFKNEASEQLVLARRDSLYLALPDGKTITLEDESPASLGHLLFHGDTGTGIACASCHPEGGDDGHAWKFARPIFVGSDLTGFDTVTRRTQNLRAGIKGKLHWDGEFDDMAGLMNDVFSRRMGGFDIITTDAVALEDWLGTLAPEPNLMLPAEKQLLVTRGEQLFQEAGCAGCHSGNMFTDYELHDVGTGGMRKTPTLRGIGQRNLLMSDGCASTLEGRFDVECGGGDKHGTTSNLSEEDKDALVAYLERL